jgi:type III secretory pathway component EscR
MHLLSQAARFFVYVILPFVVGAIVFVAILAALGMAHVSFG